jgi:hypothetical protein
MLERLAGELRASGRPSLEVLLVHDDRPGDVAEAERILAPTGVDVRVIAAPGADYYELKNAGVRAAVGELVVFLDCDVVPEAGWLGEMLAPLDDPGVDGNKAMALASFFEARTEAGGVVPTDRFFANALAVRRETALTFPFPRVAGASRGSCVVLARELADAGVTVICNQSARAEHPVPTGVRRAVRRALIHGRDAAVLAEREVRGPRILTTSGQRARTIVQRGLRERQSFGLSAAAAPVAIAIALAYYAVVGAGAALARVAPTAVRELDL